MLHAVSVLFAILLLLGMTCYSSHASEPRFIMAEAWPLASVEELKQYIDHESNQVINGAILRPRQMAVFNPQRIPRSVQAQDLETLQSLNLRERDFDVFLRVLTVTEKRVDWFDDEAWNNIDANLADLAWLAKQGQAKGICLDPEHYGNGFFSFNPTAGHTFEATYRRARERGASLMRAIGTEYPDITILCFWLMSILSDVEVPASSNGEPVNIGGPYNLFPAFVDGMLDELPPQAILVDGCENTYYIDQPEGFLREYFQIRSRRGKGMRLISPENHHTYQTQVEVGFGIYMDMFFNPAGHRYSFGARNAQERLDKILTLLSTASEISDRYVWLYGENGRWWPRPYQADRRERVKASAVGGRLWVEHLPELYQAMAEAKIPVARRTERQVMADFQKRAADYRKNNLLANSSFEADSAAADERATAPGWSSSPIPGYSMWQSRGSQGHIQLDREVARSGQASARIERMASGTLIQAVNDVRPGEIYLFEAYARQQLQANIQIRISWQTASGTWTADLATAVFPFAEEAGPDGWRQAQGMIRVPEGAARLVMLASVGDQAEGGKVWFDDLGVYRSQATLGLTATSATASAAGDTPGELILGWRGSKLTRQQEEGHTLFEVSGRSFLRSEDVIAVEPGVTYTLSGDMRALPGHDQVGPVYLGFSCLDDDLREISPLQITPVAGAALTELAAPVDRGDRMIRIREASGWQINQSHYAVAFDAKADQTDLPNFALSPFIEKDGFKRLEDGTYELSLRDTMPFARPAGTPLRLHRSGPAYLYTAASGAKLTPQWTPFSGTIHQWRPGTTQARVILMSNDAGQSLQFREIRVTRH